MTAQARSNSCRRNKQAGQRKIYTRSRQDRIKATSLQRLVLASTGVDSKTSRLLSVKRKACLL